MLARTKVDKREILILTQAFLSEFLLRSFAASREGSK